MLATKNLLRLFAGITIFLLLFTSSANYAWSAKTSEAQKTIAKGDDYFDLGEYQKAIKYYDKALKIDPKNAYTLYMKGASLHNLGKYKDAIKYFDQSLKIDPKNAYTLRDRGLASFDLGKYQEAMKYFDKALKINPKYVDAINDKGRVFHNLGQYDQAIKQYEKVMKIDPKYAYAPYNIGLVLYDLGKYKDAIKYFDKALKIDPEFIDAINDKGNTLYEMESYDEAMEQYNLVLEIDPNAVYALYNKGNVYYMTGQYEDAIAYYDLALEVDPNYSDASYMRDVAEEEMNKGIENYRGTIDVIYDESEIFSYEEVRELESAGAFEALAGAADQILYLPEDLTVRVTDCGVANAFYDKKSREVVMCYEFFIQIAEMTQSLEEDRAIQTVASTMGFVFYHELGHALIDIYDLPTTGKEEDAADQISTLIILSLPDEDSTNPAEIVLYASDFFYIVGSQQTNIEQLAFWDEHSLEMQRFYNLVCMVYGNNPVDYDYLIGDYLPLERAPKCIVEYNKVARSWNTLLSPYLKE